MRRADAKRATHRLTRRNYALTARRGTTLLLGALAVICAFAALAATGFAIMAAREHIAKVDALCAPPVSERELRERLARAQFALEHAAATQRVTQAQADEHAAQLAQLRTELAFYRRQRAQSE
jgi:hypothetical protein